MDCLQHSQAVLNLHFTNTILTQVGCQAFCTVIACRIMNYEQLPDVRDGLTREERVVLWVLSETQKERGGRNVPTTMLWGRVCEHFYISPEALSAMLARLGAQKN